jgi:hypothetical protein
MRVGYSRHGSESIVFGLMAIDFVSVLFDGGFCSSELFTERGRVSGY